MTDQSKPNFFGPVSWQPGQIFKKQTKSDIAWGSVTTGMLFPFLFLSSLINNHYFPLGLLFLAVPLVTSFVTMKSGPRLMKQIGSFKARRWLIAIYSIPALFFVGFAVYYIRDIGAWSLFFLVFSVMFAGLAYWQLWRFDKAPE